VDGEGLFGVGAVGRDGAKDHHGGMALGRVPPATAVASRSPWRHHQMAWHTLAKDALALVQPAIGALQCRVPPEIAALFATLLPSDLAALSG
jgi:hypothetical protein